MGRTDPTTQAETLRQLIQEANGTLKDLRDTIEEARRTGPALVDEYLAAALEERLTAFDTTLARLADTAATRAETVHTALEHLRDAITRIATTPDDDKPGTFDCPRCGAHLDAHEHIGNLTAPVTDAADTDGFTICAYCGQLLILTPAGPRHPTSTEETTIRSTPEFRRADTLRAALDLGTGGLDRIRGLIERGSLATPGARALRARVSGEDAARVVAMSKQPKTGRGRGGDGAV